MSNYTDEELNALGEKLDAVELTDREREILDHIIDAATGGEVEGFGGDSGELSDDELSAVAGGTKKSFGKKLKKVDFAKPWVRGVGKAPGVQEPTWANSAVVDL